MAKGKKRLAFASAAMLGLLCAPAAWAANVDTVYTNGNIYTFDDIKSGTTYDFTKVKDLTPQNARKVEVVATKDGKIIFAGSRADAQSMGMLDAAKTVDLNGRTMLPGFIDGHGHFPMQGTDDLYKVFLGSPPLGTMTSIEDYKEALNKACANAKEGDGVLGSGYDDTLITDMRHPTWGDIEGAPACKGKRVRLSHISGHVAVVSKQLLLDAGLMTEDGTPTQKALDTPGVVVTDGKVTGVLMETVAMGAAPTPTVTQDAQKALARANDVYLAKGVVMADSGGSVLMGNGATNVTFQTGYANGNLTLRTNVHPILNAAYGGAYNLMSLGWTGLTMGATMPTSQEMVDSDFKPGPNSPKTGADITKMKMLLTPDFTPDPNLPDNMMFLGAYKILGDGSPQAYTAWMKDPGNYNWGTYTAEDSFSYTDGEVNPDLGAKYVTTRDPAAAPTTPPYFNGLPGTVNVYPKDLQNLVEVAQRVGHSTETHTNGSAYAEAWMEALEKAVSKYPDKTDTRHCSIHAQTFELGMLQRIMGKYADVDKTMTTQLFGGLGDDRGQPGTEWNAADVNNKTMAEVAAAMKAQNIVPNYFVTHTYFYGERHKNIFFGPGRANNISPAGWSVALGTPFAFHNDTDITPIDPLQSVESAVTRLSAKSLVSPGGVEINGTGKDLTATVTEYSRVEGENNQPVPGSEMKFYNYDQRLNVAQALLGVTLGPVYQNKIDHLTGTIEVNKFADFVILDSDPMVVGQNDPTKLSDIRVTTTIVGDKPLYGILPMSQAQMEEEGYTFNLTPAFSPSSDIPTDVTVTVTTAEPLSRDDDSLIKTKELGPDEQFYGAYYIEAKATGENGTPFGVATLQMHILGPANSTPANFTLYVDGAPYAYSTEQEKMAESGKFWMVAADDPTNPLPADYKLVENKDYLVVFTLPVGTARAADGKVAELIYAGAKSSLPNNNTPVTPGSNGGDDDDDSGCTVGSRPAYDLGILAAMFAGLFGLSGLRRRFAKKN